MVARKDKTPEPLYRPRGRKCSRVRLEDWVQTFERASVGIPFYVHRDELPKSAVRNFTFRIGERLGLRYALHVPKDESQPLEFVRK